MFRSLHMRLVLILVLLIVSLMAVVGTFMISSVSSYHINDFRDEMQSVFTTDFIKTLNAEAEKPDAVSRLKDMLSAYSGTMGIDAYRNFYILDGQTGDYLAGSGMQSAGIEKTPNIITAVGGEVGQEIHAVQPYMDIAIPIAAGKYIVYVRDTKEDTKDLSWKLFGITIQALLLGLIVAILISFLLSKTMTSPIEQLTESATKIAKGDFSEQIEVQSSDEIGTLTSTFNEMANTLHETLEKAEGERTKLNTLFLHMADGVAAFTQDGHLLHMNPAAEKMLVTRFDENMTYGEVFPDLGEMRDMMTGGGDVREIEYGKNGRSLQIFFAPFRIPESGNGLMAVIHDVTEQKRLDQSRKEFVANVSHAMRTPLTNTQRYTETLAESAGELPEETEKQFLGVISSETDRMTNLVKDLLTLSRLDYAGLEMNFERFSLKDLIESVYHAMQIQAEKDGYDFACHIEEDLPDMVGDRSRIEQVIVNIVSNALKYTPAGGMVHIDAGAMPEHRVFVSVRDNGIGIPKEDQARLFERFYRVDKARARERGGTGLGLAIAKEITTLHNGEIQVESEPNKGTRMTIILPTDLPEGKTGKE